VCERLGLQCRREDRITYVVVDAIIEVAATGERDPDRVCELVLVHLRESHGGHEPAISAPPVQHLTDFQPEDGLFSDIER
jgi:hypothetical protein